MTARSWDKPQWRRAGTARVVAAMCLLMFSGHGVGVAEGHVIADRLQGMSDLMAVGIGEHAAHRVARYRVEASEPLDALDRSRQQLRTAIVEVETDQVVQLRVDARRVELRRVEKMGASERRLVIEHIDAHDVESSLLGTRPIRDGVSSTEAVADSGVPCGPAVLRPVWLFAAAQGPGAPTSRRTDDHWRREIGAAACEPAALTALSGSVRNFAVNCILWDYRDGWIGADEARSRLLRVLELRTRWGGGSRAGDTRVESLVAELASEDRRPLTPARPVAGVLAELRASPFPLPSSWRDGAIDFSGPTLPTEIARTLALGGRERWLLVPSIAALCADDVPSRVVSLLQLPGLHGTTRVLPAGEVATALLAKMTGGVFDASEGVSPLDWANAVQADTVDGYLERQVRLGKSAALKEIAAREGVIDADAIRAGLASAQCDDSETYIRFGARSGLDDLVRRASEHLGDMSDSYEREELTRALVAAGDLRTREWLRVRWRSESDALRSGSRSSVRLARHALVAGLISAQEWVREVHAAGSDRRVAILSSLPPGLVWNSPDGSPLRILAAACLGDRTTMGFSWASGLPRPKAPGDGFGSRVCDAAVAALLDDPGIVVQTIAARDAAIERVLRRLGVDGANLLPPNTLVVEVRGSGASSVVSGSASFDSSVESAARRAAQDPRLVAQLEVALSAGDRTRVIDVAAEWTDGMAGRPVFRCVVELADAKREPQPITVHAVSEGPQGVHGWHSSVGGDESPLMNAASAQLERDRVRGGSFSLRVSWERAP